MGLWSQTRCPSCGERSARRFLWMVRCPNRECSRYNAEVAYEVSKESKTAGMEERRRSPRTGEVTTLQGNFDPGQHAVLIRYRNHEDVEKTFTGDRRTIRLRGTFLSVCLAPTGMRCALKRDRILNSNELDVPVCVESVLDPVERQVRGYHKKNGTTSPRFEEVKRKLAERGIEGG